MGGLISSPVPKRYRAGAITERQIQCSIAKHACFKCANGSLDLRYHPFLTSEGNLKTDKVKPTWYQQYGIPLWWLEVLFLFGLSVGMYFVQDVWGVDKPFDGFFFSLIASFIFTAFYFARLWFVLNRTSASANTFYDMGDGAGTFGNDLSSLMTDEDLQKFGSASMNITRYDNQSCATYREKVPARDVYCEMAYLAAAIPYATINSFRDGGVDVNLLPLSHLLKEEIAYKVGTTNADHLGVINGMLKERVMLFKGAGFYDSVHRELIAQTNGLDTSYANLAKATEIAPGAFVNRFLMLFLRLYLIFIIWAFPYEMVTRFILVFFLQVVAIGILKIAEAEGLPFDNTETNPYSTVPIQDVKHVISIATLGYALSVFDKIEALGSPVALPPPPAEPVQAHASPSRRAPNGYNEYNIL